MKKILLAVTIGMVALFGAIAVSMCQRQAIVQNQRMDLKQIRAASIRLNLEENAIGILGEDIKILNV